MSVLHLAAKFGQLKVIDMLWGKTPIDQVSVKVWIRDECICKRLLFTEVILKSNYTVTYCCSVEHVRKSCFPIFKETVSSSVNFKIEFFLKTDADSVLCRL